MGWTNLTDCFLSLAAHRFGQGGGLGGGHRANQADFIQVEDGRTIIDPLLPAAHKKRELIALRGNGGAEGIDPIGRLLRFGQRLFVPRQFLPGFVAE